MNVYTNIATVISVHNRLNFTKRCLKSLYDSLGLNQIDLYLVDDGSSDGSSKWIKKNYPSSKIYRGDGNLWFGRSTQLGIIEVLKSKKKYDYVLIINNDTFLKENALQKMILVAKKKNVVALNFFQEDLNVGGTSGFFWDNWRGLVGIDCNKKWDFIKKSSEFVQVDSVSTTATLYPIKYLRNINKINVERHPHHRYDIMLASVCKKQGAKFLVSTDYLANHYRCNENRLAWDWYQSNFQTYFKNAFLNPLHTEYIYGLIESNFAISPRLNNTIILNLKLLILTLTKLIVLLLKSLINSINLKNLAKKFKVLNKI